MNYARCAMAASLFATAALIWTSAQAQKPGQTTPPTSKPPKTKPPASAVNPRTGAVREFPSPSTSGATTAGDAAMNAFVSSLLGRMTLEEKIGQLNLPSVGFDVTGPIVSQGVDEKIRRGLVGGVFNTFTPGAVRKLQDMALKNTRLHIPLLFGYDVIHGHKTIFPIPLGLSCTWDTTLIEKSARIAATEASADGLNWVFSPMVDIARDPRWGRIAEGAGEDPYLGSLVARAMVKGYQGQGLDKENTVMACVKHFALYGAAEAGRDYNTVDMSPLKMTQYYLPPYKAAVQAGAGSVMTSFNEINGVPATANKWLLTDLLRKQWGFKGMIVTDYTAINELSAHGLGDLQQASALALKAGVDMDMVGEGFLTTLKTSLREGKITQNEIDMACRRVLEAKFRLGLFRDPYRNSSEERAAREIETPENRAAAREIARHSFVLLKNAGQVLPLKRTASIALIGPLANDHRDLIGNWSAAGDGKKAVTVMEGIRSIGGASLKLSYAKGANLIDDPAILLQLNANGGEIVPDPRSPEEMIQEAVNTANGSDIVVAVLGEPFGMTGEAASRSDISLPENQEALLRALVRTGKPVVLVLMNGRPLTLPWEDAHAQAILETWYGGTEAGNAIADVLFGDYDPSGKLTTSWPRNVGQIPLYYNHKNTGRPYDGQSNEKYKSRYLDVSNDPLYPFGFGMSYTHFTYSGLTTDRGSMRPGETMHIRVTVTNSGDYDGEETAQLYTCRPVASVTQPVKELKGFRKLFLKKGESRELDFTLAADDLRYYGRDLRLVNEPGRIHIYIGPNSRDTREAGVSLAK
ncbi:MAG: beta-glucosidase BglX [Bacteroidota bacterium]|nr:beta-glucosidase BglX [Bacteroidota bacterium]MDP4253005.1 beta-glucosidase BglX [Bacteroidota bacterium]MDP4258716.1 beta-glucosidase BglX [Bacteroidota bacterium]